jgi:hypothetical protein
MRNKLTTDYILEMLKEVKSLCDTNAFNNTKFQKSHPHFNSILKAIETKGIYNKSKNEFTHIEPNEIMAKEVFRLAMEERKELLENKKMTSFTKEEIRIDLERKSYFESLELQILEVKKENLKLKQVAEKDSNLKRELQDALNANASLIKKIGEFQQASFLRKEYKSDYEQAEAIIDKYREILRVRDKELASANETNLTLRTDLAKANENTNYQEQRISEYEASLREFQEKGIVRANAMADNKKIIENQTETIRTQKQEINDLMDMVSEQREFIIEEKESRKNLKKSKKLKVFGITVYSLEFN